MTGILGILTHIPGNLIPPVKRWEALILIQMGIPTRLTQTGLLRLQTHREKLLGLFPRAGARLLLRLILCRLIPLLQDLIGLALAPGNGSSFPMMHL